MILDDHDVTDDWNLHRQWVETVHGRPIGRRVVQNALAAYAVFQGWGNEPDRYAPGEPGGRLLAALGRWRGAADRTAEEISAAVGLPSTDGSPRLDWDYAVDTTAYQAIVLDTRTRRGFRPGGAGRAAPALLGDRARETQLTRRRRERRREVPLTIVVSAAPVFGHPLIEVWLQLKKIKAIEWLPGAPAAVDRELYTVDFGSDPRLDGPVPGRSHAEHDRAVALRDRHSWAFMNCVVGRNNLGDVEFLAPGPDGAPGVLRQSLWFDKTSIRSGGEPERLPYTVHDLPLDPAEEEG